MKHYIAIQETHSGEIEIIDFNTKEEKEAFCDGWGRMEYYGVDLSRYEWIWKIPESFPGLVEDGCEEMVERIKKEKEKYIKERE